ncbi:GNAT family N-acetyltransferase [Aurantiacibacter aquimixticola]|uniref:N-acetyltransferase n=1 Tax=Aurantiacibacter aquimixticola TaxID=1958945 RepID=A0A419RQG0_9SPHN|nr:GNAT family N-acetyltransferase [Aurantiacibacter aquimixticola]RJY08014.1 N-acetyltransferase [Aurantiacibacter aquimixticola]
MFMRTERLFLRPIFPEDWRGVFRGIAVPGIVRNLARAPWPYGEEDARSFCAGAADGDGHRFAITLPETREAPLIGLIGFDPDEEGAFELGYWIGEAWQGRGYATEAAHGVLAITDALGIEAVGAGHFLDNPASGRVLRKLGFAETGEVRLTACAGRGGEQVPTRRYIRRMPMAHPQAA